MLVVTGAEGVLVVKKDTKKEKHDLIDVSNLHVLKLMISLKSRGFVKETFNWQYSYYTLTDAGIDYIRTYMAIPADTVPDTLKEKAVTRAPRGDREGGFGGRGRGGDREGGFGGRGGRGGFSGRGREGGFGSGRGRGGDREGGFGAGRGRGFGGRGRGSDRAAAPTSE